MMRQANSEQPSIAKQIQRSRQKILSINKSINRWGPRQVHPTLGNTRKLAGLLDIQTKTKWDKRKQTKYTSEGRKSRHMWKWSGQGRQSELARNTQKHDVKWVKQEEVSVTKWNGKHWLNNMKWRSTWSREHCVPFAKLSNGWLLMFCYVCNLISLCTCFIPTVHLDLEMLKTVSS